MKLPITRKILKDWSGPQIFQQAQQLWERGGVVQVEYAEPVVTGRVAWGKRELRTSVKLLPDGTAENLCPCHDNQEKGLICVHVVALGLEILRRAQDPERERKIVEEQRKAERVAQSDESQFLKRVPIGTSGAMNAQLRIVLSDGWREEIARGRIGLRCMIEYDGQRVTIGEVPIEAEYAFPPADAAILFVIEDICDGPALSQIDVSFADFVNLLDLLQGQKVLAEDTDEEIPVHRARVPSRLCVDLDQENGELLAMIQTELPFLKSTECADYVVCQQGGYAYGAQNFWPLENLLPPPFQDVYREPIVIQRPAILRFVEAELPLLAQRIPIVTDLSLDLFTIEPEIPRMLLHVKGSPAVLVGTVYAEYGSLAVIAGKPDPEGHFSNPDPDDLLRYTIRNFPYEAKALEVVGREGFSGSVGDELDPIRGTRDVLNFLASAHPKLRRLGWRVEWEGRISDEVEKLEFVTPVVRVNDQEGGDWFDVRFDYEDGQGGNVSTSDIQRALRRGENYLERGARTILIDGGAVDSLNEICNDCASGDGGAPGSFRLSGVHSAYMKSSLDALDGVDVEATPTWQLHAEQKNRTLKIEPIVFPADLDHTLRPYQKEGVHWLTFLEQNGFCGILADEMGLGKTLQALTWLRGERATDKDRGQPALIVCPTSLVENWEEEASRFFPDMKVLLISGAHRSEKWEAVESSDLVITSYALMRRDIDRYIQIHFFAVLLDEAQHIKNHSTQNSKAAKKLRGSHKLVLTGTPIENSVSDLWSIMDFLMPGYLGGYKQFRERYEIPIGRGDRDGEEAQARLRRKVHPFLLRRLKKDVAKELPPKIQRVAKFTMSRDQQKIYKELLESSQRRLLSMVSKQGFDKSRMEVFKTLLRLRQVCCHLDLLKLPDLDYNQPSAKMDLFFELLDEAIDGGHRVLVFSQFVSMLTLLRKELEQRGLAYCYLDGSTKNRMENVRQFNTNRQIPVFLISLKAGGTGLNLTGADMVIHFDPWWNPAVENQATDRAYRIGQKRTVYSIKLIARDSVEEKVLALQEKKKAVIDATLESDEQVVHHMSWEDVQDLLSL